MTFEWRHNLDLARHLAELEDMRVDPEAYYRTSVSKAYYACHKSIHHWMDMNTSYTYNRNLNPSVHKDIIDNIPSYISNPQAQKILRYLDKLRAARTRADYEYLPLAHNWDQAYARKVISDAEFILEQLDESQPKT